MSDPGTTIRKGGRVLLVLALALVFFFLIGRSLAGLFTEVLWYRSVGYSSVFWTRTLAELGMRGAAGALTAILALSLIHI